MKMRLTKAVMEGLRPRARAYPVWDSGAGAVTGFGVLVHPSGRRVAIFLYRLKGAGRRGKTKTFTIGEIRERGLKFGEAKDIAERLRASVIKGGDPVTDEKARAMAIVQREIETKERTFKALAESWLKRKAKLRSHDELERIVNKTLLVLHKRDVPGLTAGDLDKIISDIEGRAPFMAARALQVLGWVLDHGVKRQWIATNPAQHLEVATDIPSGGRRRVLSDTELAAIWGVAEEMGWPFGRAIQLLILTAARRNEVIGLDWEELDVKEAMWHLPAERAKNGEAHDVHLAPQAIAILKRLPSVDDGTIPKRGLLFSTTTKTPISGISKWKVSLDEKVLAKLREVDPKAKLTPWRIHDLRRTAATQMAGMGFGLAVVERVLNHRGVSRSGVAGIYQRAEFLPERKAALEAWGARVEALIKAAPPPANVVSITAARA